MAIMTSLALTTARTVSPVASARSSTASVVIEAVRIWPLPISILTLAAAAPSKDFTKERPAEIAQRMAWFNDAGFGMFIHWGLYAVPAGEWQGKAGGYAIQGRAAAFVRWLGGSYTNVVGLPLFEVAQLLAGLGAGPGTVGESLPESP